MVTANGTGADSDLPGGNYFGVVSANLDGKDPIPMEGYASTKTLTIPKGNTTLTGGSQATNLMQPYLVLHYIIALFGIFPSRS